MTAIFLNLFFFWSIYHILTAMCHQALANIQKKKKCKLHSCSFCYPIVQKLHLTILRFNKFSLYYSVAQNVTLNSFMILFLFYCNDISLVLRKKYIYYYHIWRWGFFSEIKVKNPWAGILLMIFRPFCDRILSFWMKIIELEW